MKKLKSSFIIIMGLLVLSAVTLVRAQSPDSIRLPSLGKHIFTSIDGVDDPFINTNFSISIGLADLVDTEIPIYVPAIDETINFNPDLFYTVGSIKYQHEVKDWAAIYFKGGGLARIGNNVPSIASQGISAASFFNIGLMFKLIEKNNLSFAGSVDLNTSSLTYIDFDSMLVEDEADTSFNGQVINNFQILSGGVRFRFAYKFNEIFGLVANTSGSFGEIYASGSSNNFSWTFGSLLSVDLRNWIKIPFGIGFGGTIISKGWEFRDTDQPIYTLNLNIAFINQNDFVVGLENSYQRIKDNEFDQAFYFYYSRIYIGYYF